MSKHRASPLGKLRAVVIILCVVIILGILAYAYLKVRSNSVLGKDEILEKIGELSDEDLGYTFVSSYLAKYGIRNFNTYKLNGIEMHLEENFYKSLPSERDIARSTALLFVNEYYDKTDLENTDEVTDAILKCLIESIGDKYAYYRTKAEFAEYLDGLESGEEFVGIGIQINTQTLEIIMVFKGSGADDAGVKPGDILWGVGDKTVDDTPYDELVNMLKGEPDTDVKITVKRNGEPMEFTATRRTLPGRSVYYEMLKSGVGYIHITQFLGDTPTQFKEAVDFCEENGAKALIIDVRYNSGGLLTSAISIIDYLVPDEEGRRIGSYTETVNEHVFYTEDGHQTRLPMVITCNKYTASAGELFVGAIRDYDDEGIIDATIVGSTTYGKGVAQHNYALYDLSGLTFTIGYFNPPCNVNFDGVGVKPDIEVTEVVENDATLERAIKEALNLASKQNGVEASLDAAA